VLHSILNENQEWLQVVQPKFDVALADQAALERSLRRLDETFLEGLARLEGAFGAL
jgi:hypothetical protein